MPAEGASSMTNEPRPDPTEEEIAQRCDEIRAGWTDQIASQRAKWADPVRVEIHVVKLGILSDLLTKQELSD